MVTAFVACFGLWLPGNPDDGTTESAEMGRIPCRGRRHDRGTAITADGETTKSAEMMAPARAMEPLP